MGQTLDVIWVSVRAILQVFICVGVGAVLAHMGHLGRETLTSLGKISYYVLIPSMAFYKICVGVRLEQLVDAWPFLVYPSLFALGGFLVGVALNRLLRVESKPLRHSIVVTLMFGNFGNLPFSLLETIMKDVPPFSADPYSLPRSLAYASIFLSTASLWLWSFGPWYIRNSRPSATYETTAETASSEIETPKQDDENGTPLREMSTASHSTSSSDETPSEAGSPTPLRRDFGNELGPSMDNDDYTLPPPQGLEAFSRPPRLPLHRRAWLTTRQLLTKLNNSPIWSIVSPTTIACIVAVLMLAASPVHRLFFVPATLPPAHGNTTSPMTPSSGNSTAYLVSFLMDSYNNTPIEAGNADTICLSNSANPRAKPPLQFVSDSIGSLANTCVPISLLLLGSNLYSTVKTQWARARLRRNGGGGGTSHQSTLPLPKRVLFGAVLTRLVILPIIFYSVTWIASKTHLLPSDPLVTMVLFLESCMPSAINLVILAQLQDDQLAVEQLSTILLAQYIFCTVSIFACISVAVKLFL